MKKLFVILTIMAGTAIGMQAEEASTEAPFQASLTPDIAIHPKTTQINGFAINIWGENPQHALNLGIINGSTGDSMGFSWGLANYAESYTGVAWAFVNISDKSFVGWQAGAVNYSKGTFFGFQSGFVNIAQEFKGLQWGAINYAENLNQGVQIGFINVAMNNPWFEEFPQKLAPGFPFVNWSF